MFVYSLKNCVFNVFQCFISFFIKKVLTRKNKCVQYTSSETKEHERTLTNRKKIHSILSQNKVEKKSF